MSASVILRDVILRIYCCGSYRRELNQEILVQSAGEAITLCSDSSHFRQTCYRDSLKSGTHIFTHHNCGISDYSFST